MKKSSFFLLLLVPSILFIRCYKYKNTTLDFTFTDANNNQPIQDLEIYLQEFDLSSTGNVSNKVTIASYKTDALGRLYTKARGLKPKKSYAIEWQKPSECYEASGYAINVDKQNSYERTLIAGGIFMLYVKNSLPFNSNDSIIVDESNTREVNINTFKYGANVGVGVNYSYIVDNQGKKKWYIHWRVVKNNISSVYLDSITTLTCDTTRFHINY